MQKHAEIPALLSGNPCSDKSRSAATHALAYGVAHLGYIPNATGRVVGASKLARVVEIVARRPQIQERMTSQVANAIFDGIKPDGVGVVIQAEHLCMVMRGIKKPGSTIVTSAVRGTFRSKPTTRAEFFSLLQNK